MDLSVITGVSVSHERASVEEIESARHRDQRTAVETLLARDGVDEAFALQTCNRAEAYVVTSDASAGRAALADFAPEVRDGAVVELDHEASLRHLMRVAAGLESLVVGEDQILGQLSTAVEEARGAGGVGPVLDDALTKAIHVGERARTETGINEGVTSLGSAAVELVERDRSLEGATALVVGAGEMGTLAARALAAAGTERVVVANRTLPHAEHVVRDLAGDGRAVGLDAVPAAAREADVVCTATGAPGYAVTPQTLAGAGETVVVDLAQPRDVDPTVADLDGVRLRDIDDLKAVTAETAASREEETAAVERMIDDELDHLLARFKRKRADQVISAMYEGAELTKEREVSTAISKLESQGGLTDDQRETVEALADSLVNQLLAAPTKSLREAAGEDDWTTIQTAIRLFDPEFGAQVPELPTVRSPRGADARPEEVPEDADVPDFVREQFGDD
jgi:glutamyl-tRNA reductase